MSILQTVKSFIKAVASGNIAVKRLDGSARGKCPTCCKPVVFSPKRAGEVAFKCDHCGESAKWMG